ncbi:MAG TPA: methyltransferase [Beijerinckiaceae bacterium]|nr:methyltransferase [Beijerinckiaceae bacterium]
MTDDLRTSGHLAADRRYLWGEGLREEGEHAAAADLFRQAVDIAPGWATGWFAYGRAAMEAGQTDVAREALRRCLELEPADVLGASLLLARLDGMQDGFALPEAYVAGLFDAYAHRFDKHLTGTLAYRGPSVLCTALDKACFRLGRQDRFGMTLDLGCGTGLMAAALQDRAGPIDGVDLSSRMLAKAGDTGLYRSLRNSDAVAALGSSHETYDLIIAADVVVYIGDLAPLLETARPRLGHHGLLALTAQRQDGKGYSLGADLRFSHSEAYLRQATQAAGYHLAVLDITSTRRDAGVDVPGLVAVLTPVR